MLSNNYTMCAKNNMLYSRVPNTYKILLNKRVEEKVSEICVLIGRAFLKLQVEEEKKSSGNT